MQPSSAYIHIIFHCWIIIIARDNLAVAGYCWDIIASLLNAMSLTSDISVDFLNGQSEAFQAKLSSFTLLSQCIVLITDTLVCSAAL